MSDHLPIQSSILPMMRPSWGNRLPFGMREALAGSIVIHALVMLVLALINVPPGMKPPRDLVVTFKFAPPKEVQLPQAAKPKLRVPRPKPHVEPVPKPVVKPPAPKIEPATKPVVQPPAAPKPVVPPKPAPPSTSPEQKHPPVSNPDVMEAVRKAWDKAKVTHRDESPALPDPRNAPQDPSNDRNLNPFSHTSNLAATTGSPERVTAAARPGGSRGAMHDFGRLADDQTASGGSAGRRSDQAGPAGFNRIPANVRAGGGAEGSPNLPSAPSAGPGAGANSGADAAAPDSSSANLSVSAGGAGSGAWGGSHDRGAHGGRSSLTAFGGSGFSGAGAPTGPAAGSGGGPRGPSGPGSLQVGSGGGFSEGQPEAGPGFSGSAVPGAGSSENGDGGLAPPGATTVSLGGGSGAGPGGGPGRGGPGVRGGRGGRFASFAGGGGAGSGDGGPSAGHGGSVGGRRGGPGGPGAVSFGRYGGGSGGGKGGPGGPGGGPGGPVGPGDGGAGGGVSNGPGAGSGPPGAAGGLFAENGGGGSGGDRIWGSTSGGRGHLAGSGPGGGDGARRGPVRTTGSTAYIHEPGCALTNQNPPFDAATCHNHSMTALLQYAKRNAHLDVTIPKDTPDSYVNLRDKGDFHSVRPFTYEDIRGYPMVFLTGTLPFTLTNGERQALYRYVMQDKGLIYGEDCHDHNGNRGGFHAPFREYMREIFGKPLTTLVFTHPIYHVPFTIDTDHIPYGDTRDHAPLEGIEVEPGRTGVIYTVNDYGDVWNPYLTYYKPERRDPAYRIGTNLYAYAITFYHASP